MDRGTGKREGLERAGWLYMELGHLFLLTIAITWDCVLDTPSRRVSEAYLPWESRVGGETYMDSLPYIFFYFTFIFNKKQSKI